VGGSLSRGGPRRLPRPLAVRVALKEIPVTGGGDGEVERTVGQTEFGEVGDDCTRDGLGCLDRSACHQVLTTTPVEIGAVDPNPEQSAAYGGDSRVERFVHPGLEHVRACGHGVGDLGPVHLSDPHTVRLVVH